jgi:hypothetical protein
MKILYVHHCGSKGGAGNSLFFVLKQLHEMGHEIHVISPRGEMTSRFEVAGFSEHDTFRSNQIREGQMTRERALELVEDENRPRYQNIRWYLDAVGIDFKEAISVVNKIPRLYQS